jgi:ATP-dependent Zn protease
MSDETSKLIDSEVRGLVDKAYVRATEILKSRRTSST